LKLPKVAIVVLTYNGSEMTKECLETLSKIHYSNKTVFLVDNHSSRPGEIANLKTLAKYYDHLVEIPYRNRGYSGGMNFGARFALKQDDFDYILFFSNDILPKEDFLSELVNVMEKDNEIGMATSLQYFYQRSNEIYFAGSYIIPVININHHIHQLIDQPKLDYIVGSVFLIRKDCYLQLNGFDEEYYNWYEDCDLSMRAKKLGWKLAFVKESIIWHKAAQTVGKQDEKSILHSLYYHSRNRVLFVKKNKSVIEYIAFLIYLLIVEPFIVFWRDRKKVLYTLDHASFWKKGLMIVRVHNRGVFNAIFSTSSPEPLKTIPSEDENEQKMSEKIIQ